MDPKTILPELRAAVETERQPLIDTAKTIWQNPEVAFTEFKASKLLVELLKKYGFTVEYPYAGMETAFRAEYTHGNGGATFVLAAEYDALAAFVCSLIIAVVTFGICMGGLRIGRAAGTKLSGKASILGGVILILIGLEIFLKGVL